MKLNPGDIPRFDTVSVDARVLLVALALSLSTGLVSGIWPAIFMSRSSINGVLKGSSRRGVAGSFQRGRFALIVMEIALSVVLLAGAGLLIRSYLALAAVEPGFSSESLTFRLTLDERYNTPQAQSALYRTFLERLQQVPGVKRAGASNSTPLSHQETLTFVEVRGFGKAKEMIENREVTPDYLPALGTALLLGRSFTAGDINSRTPVMLVNRKFVDTYLRGRDPLGQQVRLGMGNSAAMPWSTIVGVVADIRHNKLEEAGQPQVFQAVDHGREFALECGASAQAVVEQARAVLQSLDSALTLESVKTMRERMNENNARRRFQTMLLTGFGGIAIILALVGIYGLMSYTVKERTAEIGIRMALGSSQGRVIGLILWQGLRLVLTGLMIGLVGAFALTRLVSTWLFGVKSADPATFLVVPLFVLMATCCACLIPAWGATRIDPVQALRQE